MFRKPECVNYSLFFHTLMGSDTVSPPPTSTQFSPSKYLLGLHVDRGPLVHDPGIGDLFCVNNSTFLLPLKHSWLQVHANLCHYKLHNILQIKSSSVEVFDLYIFPFKYIAFLSESVSNWWFRVKQLHKLRSYGHNPGALYWGNSKSPQKVKSDFSYMANLNVHHLKRHNPKE